MQVFKFGGASIETVERARNAAQIVQQYSSEPLVVVLSAKGKTTNFLERIFHCFLDGKKEEAFVLVEELEKDHLLYAEALLGSTDAVLPSIREFIQEIEWVLDEPSGKPTDYYYDQIVCIGELLSTYIFFAYCKQLGLSVVWQDIRGIIKTDDAYRAPTIHWEQTEKLCRQMLAPLFQTHTLIITQGFIGSTLDNNSVTLGREGSDYTAAVLGNMLDAKQITIWKDVPSLLNADPKIFPNTQPIHEISYREVIEMAYYGAQVIHPKTIKPLYSKNIPLFVRCFLDPSLPGTKVFQTEAHISYPPILVLKKNQVLLEVRTKDYSFITEDNLSKIYNLFHAHRIKINLIQNAAISFVACVDAENERLPALRVELEKEYLVKRNEDLFLFTVRHYTQTVLKEELKNRTVLLTQKTRQTIQVIAK